MADIIQSNWNEVNGSEDQFAQFGTGGIVFIDPSVDASQLQGWAASLTEQADILLYGCDVAAGEQGTAFVMTSRIRPH